MAFALIALTSATLCSARLIFRRGPGGGGAGGDVNLPYMLQDNSGNNWRIYQGGWFQQNSNMPLYSQGAVLWINGQVVQQNNNSARLDQKTGELVFENINANGCSITRRVLIDKTGSYVRYIDIFKNTQPQQQTLQVMVQSTCNYGINMGNNVPDPRKKDQSLGWVGLTGANQAIVEMYAGSGAKQAPTVTWPQGNNVVQATMPLTLAPGKEAALMHLHTVSANTDSGARFMTDLKEAPLLKSIPAALRHLIVNFRSGQDFIGDIEVLRGELLDVVELRSGDQYKGTLQIPAYELATFYGKVNIPVQNVIGIINVGQFRPRQLIVTSDGQIFGGNLKDQLVKLQMSSRQITEIPLSQVSRVGYRKRPDEPQEWTLDKPMVFMRTGERVNVLMPTTPLSVVTRYGTMVLKPDQIAGVQLQNEENNVHEIELVDGSKFAGLITADSFQMNLDTGAGPGAAQQPVTFPTSAIARLQFNTKVKEPDDTTPIIRLSNDDQLSGTLIGKMKLDSSFDTIEVNAPELHSMTHAAEGGTADVQITLWDGTSVSGQLEDPEVTCQLLGGVKIKIPVPLVHEYIQPLPQPSASMVEKIKQMVASELVNEDWHVRDRARAQLLSMGPAVASVLKSMRDSQPPEAQKSIDLILAELDKQRKAQNGGTGAGTEGAGAGGGGPVPPQALIENVIEDRL